MMFVEPNPNEKPLALQDLTDRIDAACDIANETLTSREIAALLRSLAADWEAHDR